MSLRRSVIGRVLGTLLAFVFVTRPSFGFNQAQAVSSPEVLSPGYRWDVWGTREGLPSSAVQSMVQTSDGYLWIGAQDGLVRFDGFRFKTFDRKDIPGITQLSVNALFEGQDKALWIGCDGGGLISRKGDQFRLYNNANAGLASDIVNAVIQDRRGNLWVATTRGLSFLAGRKFITYTSKQGLADDWVQSLYEDQHGTVWAGTVHGLSRVEPGAITTVRLGQGLRKLEIDSIAESSAGLWLGTDQGLMLLSGGNLESYAGKPGSPLGRIRSLYEARSGDLWIGTAGNGLFQLHGQDFRHYTNGGSFPGITVQGIYQDHDGSLWIGTWGDGLIRLSDEKFKTFGPNLNTAYETRDGSIWGATNGGGLVRVKDGKTTVYTTRDGLSSNLVISLSEDHLGNLWIGTDGGGLNRFSDGRFTVYDSRQGLAASSINCLYEDRQGRIWIGTDAHGLQSLEKGRFKAYTLNGSAFAAIRFIFEDREQTLWVGTENGLARSRSRSHSEFELVPGFEKDSVMFIHEDSDGVLWIATAGSGLKRLQDGRIVTYTTRDGLFDDVIWSVVEAQGTFWMTSDAGIAQVSKAELNDFALGKIRLLRSIVYGTEDGLKTSEFNGGMQPAGLRISTGQLLFPGAKGFVLMDPQRFRPRSDPPRVMVENVTIDQRTVGLDSPARVPPGQGQLEFEYTAIDLLAPEGLRFRYKLEGFDRDWINAGTRRAAYYTNIPPGEYTFRVIACNRDGACNAAGAAFPVILKAHFYQTYSFFVLCGLLVFVIALGLHRVRVRHLHAREEELASRVEERTLKLNAEIVERKRAEEALRFANNRLELILNSAGEGICGFSPEGTATFVNPAAARITGWTLAEMNGRPAHDLFHSRSANGASHRPEDCLITAAFREGAERDVEEEVFWKKDGASFPVEYTITPIWEGSSLGGAVLTFKDISARKQTEDALQHRTIELERSNADLEQFAYVASHDLQEPLRMVASFTQLLAARYRRNLDSEADDFINFAVEGATRMQALIDGLLSFARVKTRAKALEPTDSHEVLIRAMKNLSITLQEAHAEVFADPLPVVKADGSQLELLLQNLIANAVKFRGREAPCVWVSAGPDHAKWVFSVRDNGIGIDPAYKERIFGMFQRLHLRTAYPGTGIGLAICKKIVERHGGRIWVESEEGRGATFYFTMPAVDSDGDERDTSAALDSSAGEVELQPAGGAEPMAG